MAATQMNNVFAGIAQINEASVLNSTPFWHRVALPGDKASQMETALQTLLTFEPSARCDRDCIQKLNRSHGFTLEAFRTYLSAGAAFYDGTASRAPIAGTIYPPQAASAWAYELGLPETFTVADFFNRGGTSQTNALTSITSSSLLVFFRPAAIQRADENAARLFHEGLHGFGGGAGGYEIRR